MNSIDNKETMKDTPKKTTVKKDNKSKKVELVKFEDLEVNLSC